MSIDKTIKQITDGQDRIIELLEEISAKLDRSPAAQAEPKDNGKHDTKDDEKPARATRSRSRPAEEKKPAVTLDDVRDALTRLYDAEVKFKGHEDLIDPTDVLSRFGCEKVSQLKADRYQDVIDACDRAIETGEV